LVETLSRLKKPLHGRWSLPEQSSVF